MNSSARPEALHTFLHAVEPCDALELHYSHHHHVGRFGVSAGARCGGAGGSFVDRPAARHEDGREASGKKP